MAGNRLSTTISQQKNHPSSSQILPENRQRFASLRLKDLARRLHSNIWSTWRSCCSSWRRRASFAAAAFWIADSRAVVWAIAFIRDCCCESAAAAAKAAACWFIRPEIKNYSITSLTITGILAALSSKSCESGVWSARECEHVRNNSLPQPSRPTATINNCISKTSTPPEACICRKIWKR